MEYKIMTGFENDDENGLLAEDDLEEMVNLAIQKGFTPIGSLVAIIVKGDLNLYQPMIREDRGHF